MVPQGGGAHQTEVLLLLRHPNNLLFIIIIMNELNEIVVEERRENDKVRMDKDEHEKKCAQYSTIAFLSGIACIMFFGIVTF